MSSGGVFFFLRRLALVVGVLFSLKSLLCLLGCLLACFLRRVALHAVLSALGFFEGLLYLWGCLACGVAWLVER